MRARSAAERARPKQRRACAVESRRMAISAAMSSAVASSCVGARSRASAASARSAASKSPSNTRRRAPMSAPCAALRASPLSARTLKAAFNSASSCDNVRCASAISAAATMQRARPSASFGPKPRAARRNSLRAVSSSPSCAMAMPRSASAGGSPRRATPFSAPSGSPAAKARADSSSVESMAPTVADRDALVTHEWWPTTLKQCSPDAGTSSHRERTFRR